MIIIILTFIVRFRKRLCAMTNQQQSSPPNSDSQTSRSNSGKRRDRKYSLNNYLKFQGNKYGHRIYFARKFRDISFDHSHFSSESSISSVYADDLIFPIYEPDYLDGMYSTIELLANFREIISAHYSC